ncbi:MAG TPA: HlyD family secretion protein [Bryobacteraceae bacterium]|nr:HlyD family secretion protein [Bryobacteraceae bacterium]
MAERVETEPRTDESVAPSRPPSGEVRPPRPVPPVPVRRSFVREHPLGIVLGLLLLAVVAIAGLRLWAYLSSYESTDDAQVDGHIYPISPRISGRVTAVHADINQNVTQSEVLVELDPRDYTVAIDHAKADLAKAQADVRAARAEVPITRTSTSSQVSGATAGVEQATAALSTAEQQHAAALARIREAEANYTKAQKDVERFRPLVAKEEISQQQFDQAIATAAAMAAMVDTARANADAAARQITEAQARVSQAHAQEAATRAGPEQVASMQAREASEQANAQASEASLEQAKLNLDYTKILAPVNGVVGRRSVEVGQQVQPGQELLAIVPIERLWITANYKETQLKNMRVGQKVTVHVDALDRDFTGHVDSFPGTTGAKLSLLPPENATGNFVKVVQRLPVKITLEPGQDTQMRLRPGMSVETKVWLQ